MSKLVHKIGIYSELPFACVYLKLKHNQFSKCALYRKMMQHGIKLSTKQTSQTYNNFENCYLNQSFSVKNKQNYNVQIKIKIFCYKKNICIKYFADIRYGMFLVQIDGQT